MQSYLSTGTKDYPSLQHINWTTQGEHFSAAAGIPLATAPYGMDLTDMEFQIHCIETEAYSAVLRAFVAQSDVLSWVCSTDCLSLGHFFLLLKSKTLQFSLL